MAKGLYILSTFILLSVFPIAHASSWMDCPNHVADYKSLNKQCKRSCKKKCRNVYTGGCTVACEAENAAACGVQAIQKGILQACRSYRAATKDLVSSINKNSYRARLSLVKAYCRDLVPRLKEMKRGTRSGLNDYKTICKNPEKFAKKEGLGIPPGTMVFWTDWKKFNHTGVRGCKLAHAEKKARGLCSKKASFEQDVLSTRVRNHKSRFWKEGPAWDRKRKCNYSAQYSCKVRR